MAKMDAWRGVTPASLEEEEPAPEGTEVVAKSQEVPEGATDEEAIGVTEDRSKNLRLAVGCRGRLKTRTKRDGRLRQDCAATVGRPTRRFVPALRKGGLRKGPGGMCRRSCIRGRRMSSRAGKRGMAKNIAVRETPEGRTCKQHRLARPECDHGVSDEGTRQRLHPEREKTLKRVIRQSLDLEIAKSIVESRIGLRGPGDWLLWKCRPSPKLKR
jgi:hypothetical protein